MPDVDPVLAPDSGKISPFQGFYSGQQSALQIPLLKG